MIGIQDEKGNMLKIYHSTTIDELSDDIFCAGYLVTNCNLNIMESTLEITVKPDPDRRIIK